MSKKEYYTSESESNEEEPKGTIHDIKNLHLLKTLQILKVRTTPEYLTSQLAISLSGRSLKFQITQRVVLVKLL